jgi:AraC-like DNA-binding protein
MLTAKSTEDNIITGLKDGADDYITKPFNLNILKLRIQKILEWKADNHRNFAKGIEIAPSEITVSSIDEQLIEKAIKIVEEKMGDTDFTVEEFGASIGMTRGHLYKKLMAITGKSPIEFIRAIRIKRGRSLLEQGRTNISEVAYTVGFSPKQFSKFFREEYGCLPSEFIKK